MRCANCGADNDPMAAMCADCGAALDLPPVDQPPEEEVEKTRRLEANRTAVLPPRPADQAPEPEPQPAPQAPAPVAPRRPGTSPVLAGVIAAVVVVAIGLPATYLFVSMYRYRTRAAANEPVVAGAVVDDAAVASLSREAYLQGVARLWPSVMAVLQAYSEAVETEDLDQVATVAGDQRIEMDRLYLQARDLNPPPELDELDRRLLNGVERSRDILGGAAAVASDPTNETEALRQIELLYGDSERAQQDFQYVARHAEGLELTVDARPFEATDRLAHLAEQVRIQAEEALNAPGRPTEGSGFESYDDITPPPSPGGLPEEELLPQSQHRLLTEDDLADMNRRELFVARNEISARHGRIFENEALQRYFTRWSWYSPRSDYHESELSEIERRNIDFIRRHELSR
ncbi:MAG: YARHG domain-containing protein [Armatimonadota bacterium]